jgi:hypothetical protein
MTKIIEEIREPNELISVRESIIGESHISDITVRPEMAAAEIRNTLVSSGKFENVRLTGDNNLEVMFKGLWYNIQVGGSLGNLFKRRSNMTEELNDNQRQVIEAYVWIRKNNQTIPDHILNVMKNSALEAFKTK